MQIESPDPINAGGFGNFGLGSDGFIWDNRAAHVRKLDPETGKVLQQYPLQTSSSYDNLISYDGNFWAGGGPASVREYCRASRYTDGKMAEPKHRRSYGDCEERRI